MQNRPAPSPEESTPDVRERGRAPDGSVIYSDRRLYMQLLLFDKAANAQPLCKSLVGAPFESVLYEDLAHPRGVGLLTMSEDPAFFTDTLRPFLAASPFAALPLRPESTLFGRSYTLGYESDLDQVLVNRPKQRALHPDWPWAVWYPLRRSGAFSQLSDPEQKEILGEHGRIGQAYGGADLAHDIRLACHGLDRNDNDFLVGLLGRELHPLSAVIQRMRKTVQTSRYIEKLGPFFTGRVAYQSPQPGASS